MKNFIGLGMAGLLLVGGLTVATAPAQAGDVVRVASVAVVEPVTAPEATLTYSEPEVTTTAGTVVVPVSEPVAIEPAAPATTVTTPATVEPAPAVVVPVAPVVTVEPVAPAPATVAPTAPVVEPVAPQCEEDQPCWNCATMGNGICGNPECAAHNLFTVDKVGTCDRYPEGKEAAIADAKVMAAQYGKKFERYIDSQFKVATPYDGYEYIPSSFPGMVHVFTQAPAVGSTADVAPDCAHLDPTKDGAWMGSGTYCQK
jgi:hypothetical protein